MCKQLLFLIFLFSGFGLFGQTILLEEHFNDSENLPQNWLNIDGDGDGYIWKLRENSAGDKYIYSESWSEDVILFPYNLLVTPEIDLTGLSGDVTLSYVVGAADDTYFEDHYKLCISTTGTDTSDFSVILFEETTGYDAYEGWPERLIDLTPYIGQKVYLAWIHYDCSDQYRLLIDAIVVKNTLSSGLVSSVTDNALVAYPNPVNDRIYIKGMEKGSSIELLTSEGKLVYAEQQVESQAAIDVQHFNKGLYILRIKNKDQSVVKKINVF